MTDGQILQKKRMEALHALFLAYTTLVNGSVPLKKRADKVKEYLDRIEIQQVLQEEDSKGETLDKKENRNLLIGKTVEVSAAAYAWALDNGTEVEKTDFYLVKSDFEGMAADRVWSKCEGLYQKVNLLKDVLIADYKLATKAMDDLQALVNRFDQKKNSPQEAINRRAGATKELASIFAESTPWINDDLIPFMRIFMTDEPEFHAAFLQSAKVQGE